MINKYEIKIKIFSPCKCKITRTLWKNLKKKKIVDIFKEWFHILKILFIGKKFVWKCVMFISKKIFLFAIYSIIFDKMIE